MTLRELQEYSDDNYFTKDERLILADYTEAVMSENTKRLAEFEAIGPTIRHRVMNMNQYNHNLLFGFTHKTIGKYDWLERAEFEIEEIPFVTKLGRDHNSITIGKSPNGKYTWSYHFSFGSAGSSSPLSVFSIPCNNRDEAYEKAMNYAKNEYSKYLGSNDRTNHNQDLIKQVLAVIKEKIGGNVQMQLF